MVTDQFGMIGLLTFIRAAETDPGMVHLALGSDLTTLGLNLNSPEYENCVSYSLSCVVMWPHSCLSLVTLSVCLSQESLSKVCVSVGIGAVSTAGHW